MRVAGIDEAGRGPLIGPMVMAIVSVELDALEQLEDIGVTDSKLLSPVKRESLYDQVKSISKEFYSVKIEAHEIDKHREKESLNVIEAKMASQLINKLKTKPEKIYIDCPDVNQCKYENQVYAYLNSHHKLVAEHKADLNYVVVGAASIIAKVERDYHIRKIEEEFNIEVGTGYPHDPKTIAYLKEVVKTKKIPNFVRKSWQTFINADNDAKQKKLMQ